MSSRNTDLELLPRGSDPVGVGRPPGLCLKGLPGLTEEADGPSSLVSP